MFLPCHQYLLKRSITPYNSVLKQNLLSQENLNNLQLLNDILKAAKKLASAIRTDENVIVRFI